MAFTQIYVNLPVTDLEASTSFYLALGGVLNPQFTDETSAQVALGEVVTVQLMTHEQFAQFTSRPIASGAIESILALPAESKEDVDRLAGAAVKAGGSEPRPPQDMGWLYNRAVDDPDGHSWELLSFDASAMPGTPE
ncbi:lactoylglutathione lyase [Amycolatopsis rhizosphaerae]|uniref:Lactoylglutathione lyase n=1 Tax=Amycolatopsis rhizosphaerae TaxID=2053003 RepID=A0A558CDL3_9PSEU|nr:VOC family protein [Amycolatopsis rhizosphaerae]TVT46732.1 lactoylglutathione lyase [Amycolatopsis rhizosphaerae]